jgi:aldose 1-epimerase
MDEGAEPTSAPRVGGEAPVAAEPPTGAQLELERGGQRAVVTEVGGGLRSWTVDGVERLDGFAAEEAAPDFRGRVLAPWPNRLRDGRYRFDGAEHRTPITEPERGCALHGLVAWTAWRIGPCRPDRVAVGTVVHPRPGYPFTVGLGVQYALDGEGLAVRFAATNLGAGPAPFGLGFHPYVRTGPVGATRLEVPARAYLPVDAVRLLPDGPPEPVEGTAEDFRRGPPIGDAALNACFTGLARDPDGRARIRVAGPEGAATVWMDAGLTWAMVYTADDVADPRRRRRSVAVEPMTCAPDAFNSGQGLRVLAPGERAEGSWGITPA